MQTHNILGVYFTHLHFLFLFLFI